MAPRILNVTARPVKSPLNRVIDGYHSRAGILENILHLLAIEPEFCGIAAGGLVTILTELFSLYHAGFCLL